MDEEIQVLRKISVDKLRDCQGLPHLIHWGLIDFGDSNIALYYVTEKYKMTLHELLKSK